MIVSKKLHWQRGTLAQFAEIELEVEHRDNGAFNIVVPNEMEPCLSTAISFAASLFAESYAAIYPNVATMSVRVTSIRSMPCDTTAFAMAYVTFHALCAALNLDGQQKLAFDQTTGAYTFAGPWAIANADAPPASRDPGTLASSSSRSSGWRKLLLIAAALVLCAVGYLIGAIAGQEQLYWQNYESERAALNVILRQRPEYNSLRIYQHSRGWALLGGTVATNADLKLLKVDVIDALGRQLLDRRLAGISVANPPEPER